MESRVRGYLVTVIAFSLLALTVQHSAAKCDPTGADAADVAAARAAVAACDCTGAKNHGEFVSCAAGKAKETLTNRSCMGFVVSCAAHSTCGKPGFVTCCRTTAAGKTKCSTKSGTSHCTAPKNGSSCVGNFPSCCDACGATGGCPSSPSGAFLDTRF